MDERIVWPEEPDERERAEHPRGWWQRVEEYLLSLPAGLGARLDG